jgi:hypothetical protein
MIASTSGRVLANGTARLTATASFRSKKAAALTLLHQAPLRCHATQQQQQQAQDRAVVVAADDPATATAAVSIAADHVLTPNGDVPRQAEVIRFPSRSRSHRDSAHNVLAVGAVAETTTPLLLNSKEHAVGYLSKILNARVYDAAIETELQEAKNLSTVRIFLKI